MFLTGICYMPIRIQIAYPSLPVKLVGSSSGLTQGPDGASHQSLEDISIMRGLPNMAVVSPADAIETRQATAAIADWPGPVYMRLGRYPVPCFCDCLLPFEIGMAADRARRAAMWPSWRPATWSARRWMRRSRLAQDRIEASVVNVSTIKPLDEQAVRDAADRRWAGRDRRGAHDHRRPGQRRRRSRVRHCRKRAALLRLGVRDVFGESGTADELLGEAPPDPAAHRSRHPPGAGLMAGATTIHLHPDDNVAIARTRA